MHLDEVLSEAELIIERTGGNDDSGSPHTIPISGENLTAGEHSDFVHLILLNLFTVQSIRFL
jgi:hypothetical protein